MVSSFLQKITPEWIKIKIANALGLITQHEHAMTITDLEKSRAKFKSLYYDDPTPRLSLSPSQEGLIVRCNNNARLQFKCTKGRLVERNFFSLFTDTKNGITKARQYFDKIEQGQGFKNTEFDMKKCDGSTFVGSLGVSIHKAREGKIVEIRVTVFDITHRLLSEHKLRESLACKDQALKDAEIAKKKMQAILRHVSHEIRTPLGNLANIPPLIAASNNPEETRELLKLMESTSQNLLVLLNDLLDMQKIESGELTLQATAFNLQALIQDAISLFEIAAQEKKLQLTYTIEKNVRKVLLGDPGRIRQILYNLLSNAIKFTESGAIHIQVRQNGLLEVSVQDSGIGIPPDKQDAIFQDFTQIHGIAVEQKGTGLGLSISRQLAVLMGGTLVVSSQKGFGSRFTATLDL